MSAVTLAQVDDQIATFWGPLFTQRLREVLLLPQLVSKEYEGAIANQGDTVRVSEVRDPTGEIRTVGVDADTFGTEPVTTVKVDVSADKRAVAAYEVQDLVELQSQLSRPKFQDGLIFAIAKKINTYLWSLVSPSTSAPDHDIGSTTAMTAGILGDARQLASEAKWSTSTPWYGLLSPAYWNDILTDSTLASSDFVNDAPMVNAQRARSLFGFGLYEDNSQTGKVALFFDPDFLLHVIQQAVQLKVSDLHSQKRFGFVLSVDTVFGAKLGIDGAKKHIKIYG